MDDFTRHLNEELKNPEFKKEWDKLELPYQIIQARIERGLTQAQLAKLAGTKQPSISKLESGKAAYNMDFLQRIASALHAEVVPPKLVWKS